MARTAFQRIHSGIEGVDAMYDNIRMGDNVVWQISRLEDFHVVVDPFVEQAIADGRTLVYLRFASHEELVPERPEVHRHVLNPHVGFEAFTVGVREIITSYGYDAFYVFDCLSELQVAWSADLMMGNFFRVTCPYLFILDTVAFFPVLRGRHSFQAIAKIRETTQLFTDLYSDGEGGWYLHPIKVWNRYSDTMFLAHHYDPATGQVRALTDGYESARFYEVTSEEALAMPERNTDSWDRFFSAAQEEYASGHIREETLDRMCNMMMSKDKKMRRMVRRYFRPADYFQVRSRMVGTGIVGGKACGMLLARKIVKYEVPEAAGHTEPHDSFYLGSDVFYSYLVANDLWGLRIEQRTEEGYMAAAPALRDGLLKGTFPADIREGLERMLEHYGQSPIIVRSSSFLEDGFGNAFAGKYESVFCANVGPVEQRLAELEDAIRSVYASMLSPSALEYRRQHGLDKVEEQMALLIMRVSGSHYGKHLFMPTAAGVGYSRSAYRWSEDLDPEAGMLRLVAGLGTRAVDRTQADYPRIVNLDRPRARLSQTWADRHRYSQHYFDALDLEDREVVERPMRLLEQILPKAGSRAVFEHDREAESRLRERGQRRQVLFASCQGLVENDEFTSLMAKILSTLERCYGHPVDIEYAINVGEDGRFVVCLLQCRPLALLDSETQVDVPELPDSDVWFRIEHNAMGASRAAHLDAAVVVDPVGYYLTPYAEKPTVARLVGDATRHFREAGKRCILLTPGRVGTSSPELGVPVTFADVCDLEGICEVASSEAGYSPELSYGSHLFQDLVEANIYYGALLENTPSVSYDPGFAARLTDVTAEVLPHQSPTSQAPDGGPVVRVYEAGDLALTLWHDLRTGSSVCGVAS